MTKEQCHVKWNKLSQDSYDRYNRKTEEMLGKVKLNHDLILCDDIACDRESHHVGIDNLYKVITTCLVEASDRKSCCCDSVFPSSM